MAGRVKLGWLPPRTKFLYLLSDCIYIVPFETLKALYSICF